MIAFYGMGLLGSNFVQALRERAEEVTVWSRTPENAEALAETGARVAPDPAAAARGAERVHITLSDDVAVDDVLERARPGFEAGVLLVDHTTTSAHATAARAARWKERGVAFLHAPVFMGPDNARTATGIMLVSGDPAIVARAKPALEKMTGALVDVGPKPEMAASMKLLGNLFLMFLQSGFVEMLTLAKALGVSPEQAASLFDCFNPGAQARPRIDRMITANWAQPLWQLAMARKDVRLMLDDAARAEIQLHVLPAIAARMDEVIAQGHGNDDWSVLAKDALEGRVR